MNLREDGRTNQSGIAKALNLSKQTISDHVKSGVIVMDSDKLLHPEKAREQMRERTHPKAKADLGENKTGKVDYHTAKTAREIAEAKIANLKFRQMDKSLVDRSLIEKLIFERGRQFRDGLMTCSRRIAPEIAGNEDIKEIEAVLSREFRLLLDNFIKLGDI